MLVDPERSRIAALAAQYGIPCTAASLNEVPSSVEGIVVAVPNHLHLPVVTKALGRGANVLCEKPLGRNAAEVTAMAAAGVEHERGVFAAMICRRYPAVRETVMYRLHELVGEVLEIDASYGFPLDWPVKSTAYYDKALSGGGALLDFGSHLVDALLFVLGHPSFDVVSYADDADGGVDAEAEGHMTVMLSHGPVPCTVRASRLRRLSNAITLRGTRAELRIPVSSTEPATLQVGDTAWPISGSEAGALPCFASQMEDFGRAIRGEAHDLPAASSQVPGICLIERLYAARTPLRFAWDA